MILRHCQWESTLECRIIYLFDGNCYYDTQYDISTLTQKPYFWTYFLRICEKHFYYLFNEKSASSKMYTKSGRCVSNVFVFCHYQDVSYYSLLVI